MIRCTQFKTQKYLNRKLKKKNPKQTSSVTFLEILQKMNTKNRKCVKSAQSVSILLLGHLSTAALSLCSHIALILMLMLDGSGARAKLHIMSGCNSLFCIFKLAWLLISCSFIIGVCRNRYDTIWVSGEVIKLCDLKRLWCNDEVSSWPWRALVKYVWLLSGEKRLLGYLCVSMLDKTNILQRCMKWNFFRKQQFMKCRSMPMACLTTEVSTFQGRLVQPLGPDGSTPVIYKQQQYSKATFHISKEHETHNSRKDSSQTCLDGET